MTPEFKREARQLLEELADEARRSRDQLVLEQIAHAQKTILDEAEHDLSSHGESVVDDSPQATLPAADLVRLHRALAERCSQIGALDLALAIRERVVVDAGQAFGPDDRRTRDERARLRGERRRVQRGLRAHPLEVDSSGQIIGGVAGLSAVAAIAVANVAARDLSHRGQRSLLVLAASLGSAIVASTVGDALLRVGQRLHHRRPSAQPIAETAAPKVAFAIAFVGPVIAALFIFKFI